MADRFLPLVRELFPLPVGVVSPANETLFERLSHELPLVIHRYPSGLTFNGWTVPQQWRVLRATIRRDGELIFDGSSHPMGVAAYSRSFRGELDLEELRSHVVTNPDLPDAYIYHCMWQYRPWAADWALSMPHDLARTLRPGRYDVDLSTVYEPGDMLVGEYEHRGASEQTIVFNAHTCHPCQANDDLAGVVVLIRVFQWLQTQRTHYSYRLILAPEHLGTVFYLRDRSEADLQRLTAGVFAEMPGTSGPVTVASSFLGRQPIDQAFANAARHTARECRFVGWREGAGNDETVWEAPGYEVPFVEVSRAVSTVAPYREYHSSLDTPDLLDEMQLVEFYGVLSQVIQTLERDSRLHRRFSGLICLSNPEYDLYFERPDPAVKKDLAADADAWGHLLDCLFRYFDGSVTVLEIAEKHGLPFDALYQYLQKLAAKGLIRFEFAPMSRVLISRPDAC